MSDDMSDSPSSDQLALATEESIYQNYTASEVLVQGLAGVVSQEDVKLMVQAQKKMLQRFEKTNAMLSNVNSLSASRLAKAEQDFKAHTQNVTEMKKDLENIFKRIRKIKVRLAEQMPSAYTQVGGRGEEIKEEDDEYDVAVRERKEKETIEDK
eukprot:GFUD01006022.1.p1 GENE.GFUD01006022.1~~GFUD01006022.1.p1  ORF type:complete len:176 (-),score=67.94 GFUD01006022.1:254-715(-)